MRSAPSPHHSRLHLVIAAASLGLAVTTGCGSLRFRDQPVVWEVDDARTIEEPEEREYLKLAYFADVFALRRFERTLALPNEEPAHNANAMEEVPDSTWFQNRMSRRVYTPVELARGPAIKGPPQPPYKIKSGKSGGGALGFVMKDAVGRSFLVKFDTKENPEMQTGTNVIVNRLFWGFGFNVPADYVFEVRRDELTIDPKAKATDNLGDKVPFTQEMIDAALLAGAAPREGAYRATASEFLEGVPKGGWSPEGTRDDDPNDVVPHEHRRELRGLRILAAWLNHTDMKEDNTLDMYVTEGKRKFLRHYFVDFGEALGGHGAEKNRREDGYEHFFDWENQGKALIAFGLWNRPWEDEKPTPYKSIGIFRGAGWDPTTWREAYPYFPFMEADRTDAFWAAKIVVRFTRPQLKAVIAEGKLSEPGAADYMLDALDARRIAIGRTYLEALSPLDAFTVEGGKLCATDLGVLHQIVQNGVIERMVDDRVAETAVLDTNARGCVALPAKTDGYAVVTLRTRRISIDKPPMEVHLRMDGEPRIVGLVRDP
jgi:hypothetical protein